MFRTVVEITPSNQKISYDNQLITIGSCFSENIGTRLKKVYFQVDTNPFGVLYNPISIKNSLDLLLAKKYFADNDIFKNGSVWSSFSHSTLFSSANQAECLTNINVRIESAIKNLQKAKYMLVTFGTAWVYQLKETGEIVSNCHKLPSNKFVRKRLSVEEIVDAYQVLLEKLHAITPDLQFIFTVSPIRHWKDGAHENNISKSILHLAIEKLKEQYDYIHYFPAYELQMDDLRDYRFYASDMFHPSETAIDYIWKRFSETYFSKETLHIKSILEELNAQLNHRPINPDSQEHKAFLTKLEENKKKLRNDYPMLKI